MFLLIALVYLLRDFQVHFENITPLLFKFGFLAKMFVKWDKLLVYYMITILKETIFFIIPLHG